MNVSPATRNMEGRSFPAFALCILALTLLNGCGSTVQASPRENAQAQPAGFVEPVNFDPAIPSPESSTGHAIGIKAVRYHALEQYLKTLAETSDRVALTVYGRSHEGRSLTYLTITSPANHERLDRIKADNAKLSDPRKLQNSAEAEQLINAMPAVAWLNYSIHGDELSSTDAAMYVAYHLAASQDQTTRQLLDTVVIHLNPLVNPDGRERYLSHLEQLTGVVSSPDLQSMQHQALWSRGRGNHYLFDLNRDWLVHVHPEVRDLAKVILSWNPHLLIDSHEQGAYETYLFDPPREPINTHLAPKVLDWRRRFSADQAAAFNQHGWSYYTKDWYSEWSPIYTNSWASILGAIGLLYEQARVDAASVKHPTGREVSYRETVHHHIVSTLANLETLRVNREHILSGYLQDRRWAINETDPNAGILLLPPCKDTSRWKRLAELMIDQGIEVGFAQESFEAENTTDLWGNKLPSQTFPKGTLIARSAQPHRRMLHALCEFDPHLKDSFLLKERKELENHRGTLLYDVSTWSLPMAFALEAYWSENVPEIKMQSELPEPNQSNFSGTSGYAYLMDFENTSTYPALVRLFEEECHPRIATDPFTMNGREYKRGTVLLRGHENPDSLPKILQKIASDFPVEIRAVESALVEDGPDLGCGKFELLAAPRVAIASQWPVYSTSFGSMWYLLDHELRLQSSPVNIQNMGSIDLRKYNVLILPDSSSVGRVIDKSAVEKIKRWVEAGGTLIAAGGSAVFAADKDQELSSVRSRRDVLDKLVEYREAVEREKNARDIKIDPNHIWGVKPTTTEDANKPGESKAKPDIEKLKRTDEWQRIFSPEGSFVTGIVNTEHWLAFGLGEKLPVMFWGSRAFMSKHPVRTVVRLADENQVRLSGLLWPEARQRLADSAYATVESVGRGQVILFATDPTYRMWLPGQQRLFLNAVLLGPGMGASQPLPW
ncbi:MAG: hypothetical protein JXM79_08750 [Sedimentisphaerales bacterium]|nr:hypothetical protein [Sedimentisphaerales bacterium]